MKVNDQDCMVVLRKLQNLQRKLFGMDIYGNVSFITHKKNPKTCSLFFTAYSNEDKERKRVSEVFYLSKDYKVEDIMRKVNELEKRVIEQWTTPSTLKS